MLCIIVLKLSVLPILPYVAYYITYLYISSYVLKTPNMDSCKIPQNETVRAIFKKGVTR